ncbi:MAG: calcium/sodium antiporter [Gammaproteobacteria bacterium RIFCSPLOWO2_02_FULL_56_15]|nr:MAG: calcium/sodium antiporter [Gammaproteobacteria bacterium RIFCSPLOWO2_02_FULL_56_15]
MTTAFIAIVIGLALLVWSANRFVEGSTATAAHFGMPPLLIGMVIVGFGTSAPEMTVSALASWQGNSGIALGNAYGSNIANITLILGVAALINPIAVHSQVLRKELPILATVTALAAWQLYDYELSRVDAVVSLVVFAGLLALAIRQALRSKTDTLAEAYEHKLAEQRMPVKQALFWVVVGLILLILSSRILVWGAVRLAHGFGVSDLIIGLTIVGVGTSLPELASSTMAARKGEHDIALGNVLGSNIFNTLVVVGIAGCVRPLDVAPELLSRDIPVMALLTLSLFTICWGFRGPGIINRYEGAVLLCAFVAYTGWLVLSSV